MQKKLDIFKKRNFLGQALDFLPPRKPGPYISRVDFFFFEYHELKNSLNFNVASFGSVVTSRHIDFTNLKNCIKTHF